MTATPWCKTPFGARSLLAFLIAPFLTLPAVAQTHTPIYPVPTISPVNPTPSPTNTAATVTTGDFNGDGLTDVAYISTSGAPNYQIMNGITVVLNEGPNNPTVSVPTSGLSCTPQNIVAADINKDSKLDVVLTCVEGYVAVLFGNGDGSFQTPSYYAVPNVRTVAPPVDLNGDGYPDIAVTVSTNPPTLVLASVAVLLNEGSNSPGALSPVSSYPQTQQNSGFAISSGDFNGDGKADIIAGNPAQVFYGNGDGTLQAPVLTTATSGFATGDLNGDGKTDIAYVNVSNATATTPTTYSLQILLGNSSGQFTTGEMQPIPTSFGLPAIVPFQNTSTSTVINLALVGSSSTIIDLNDGKGNFSQGLAYGVSANFVTTQLGASGNTNLLFSLSESATQVVPGNGDGTFQAPPSTILDAGGCVFTDVNSDGLTDTLCIDSASNLVTALGRGNGRFSKYSQNSTTGQIIVTGDFNGDGKVDAVTISYGTYFQPHDLQPPPVVNGKLSFYSGNGDGTFQTSGVALDLGYGGVDSAIVGDFNGDKILDLVIPFGCNCPAPAPPSGVLFLAGKGDGTFAAPVALPIPFNDVSFAADVNNDGKLDIIGTNTISLGNGDGTFQQLPLGIAGIVLAATDLNGDGKADLVINTTSATAIFAGNGDGTFQTTPYFTTPLTGSAYIGDVNGDGHADLLLASTQLSVLFGDGTGNFTLDPNTYPNAGAIGALARVNNQAPSLPNDHTLDYVFNSGGGVTSFINQLNPAPTTPALLPSKTTLAASANSAAPGQQLTLTAAVTGATPTGTVSFVSDGKALGTAPITNGTATLAVSFPAAGTITVIANFPGDINNTPSSSNPLSLTMAPVATQTVLEVSSTGTGLNTGPIFYATVSGLNPTGTVTFNSGTTTLGTAPVVNQTASFPYTFLTEGTHPVIATYSGDVANLASTSNTVIIDVPAYSITISPISAVVKAGQSATATFTVNPSVGYTGTLKFACGPLPTGVTCTFTPASITPSSGPATTTLTITTTAPTTALLRRLSIPFQGTAFASFLFLILIPRRSSRWNRSRRLIALMMAAGLISLSGCSSSSPSSSGGNTSATPAGVYDVVVNVTDSTTNAPFPLSFQVTVQ